MSELPKGNVDIRQHDLSCLYTDAIGLFHLGRKYSALLLLLCTIDALAKRAYPDRDRVGDRFVSYLRERLPEHTRVQNYNIRVPKLDKSLRIEEILYAYLRCPIVHEMAALDMRESSDVPVLIDWADGATYVQVDNDADRVVLGGEYVIAALTGVVQQALAEGMANRTGQGPSA